MTTFRSATCATDILQAWHEDDRELLNRRLEKGATPEIDPDGNSHECERLELLDGIASEIRCSIASNRLQDATVYLPLLRHLAESAGAISNGSDVC